MLHFGKIPGLKIRPNPNIVSIAAQRLSGGRTRHNDADCQVSRHERIHSLRLHERLLRLFQLRWATTSLCNSLFRRAAEPNFRIIRSFGFRRVSNQLSVWPLKWFEAATPIWVEEVPATRFQTIEKTPNVCVRICEVRKSHIRRVWDVGPHCSRKLLCRTIWDADSILNDWTWKHEQWQHWI